MTMNDVVWRQACALKKNADALIQEAHNVPELNDSLRDISTQSAVVICYASYATGDVSPMPVYDDIIEQVGYLQTSIWKFIKNCAHDTLKAVAQKVYTSCATLKKRLRRRLKAIAEATESLISETFSPTTETPVEFHLEQTPLCPCRS